MYIYKVTNTVNGMVYIGKTKNSVESRWKQHCYQAKGKYNHCKFKLQDAINEFGAEHFTVEQIDVAATNEEANKKEMYWIAHYDSINNGYNTSIGGRNGANRKRVMNVETGEVFDSVVAACKAVGVSHSALHFVIDNPKLRCRGFHWVSV